MDSAMKASITFVSAGAGSGKTHRLTELLHYKLITGSVRPAGVIATTFTKKAAAELRERVREHLLAQGNFGLANAIGQARIGTVNSVCGQLIARFAFEAGLSVDQEVLEIEQAKAMLDKAIDTVLDGTSMRELLALIRRLGCESDWKNDLQSLVSQIRCNDISVDVVRDFAQQNADDLLGHFPKPTVQDLDAALSDALCTALPIIEAAAKSREIKKTKDYLTLIRACLDDLQGSAMAWSDWPKLAKSTPEAALCPDIERIAELAGRVAEHPRLQVDLRRYLEVMFDLAVRSLDSYQALKREQGALDFVDQEHQVVRLLGHPEVAAVLDAELDLLMVDEFQDTSPIQLALFLKLARFAKQVVWVGDIKQAIYGFRGSDPELMQAILGALSGLGGTKEILPCSWRSRPELVRITNAVFSRAFAATLKEEEVVLVPTRESEPSQASIANWILGGKTIDHNASALATGVGELVASGYRIADKARKETRSVRFGDIAILSPTGDGVRKLVKALAQQGLPVATAQPGLLATPEATLAMACLRRLNDSGDTLATAEIVSLADCEEPELWVADRLRYLASGAEADLWREQSVEGHPAHPLLKVIASLRASLPLLTPREALVTLIANCALAEKVIRWSADTDQARMRLANLDALVALAMQYEDLCRNGRRAASISGLILWLGEVAEDEQDLLAEPAIDAVKVMTHHAAKGLEWPVVVLTGLNADIKDRIWSISAQSRAELDVQDPLANRFIRYWPWPFGKQKKVAITDEIVNKPELGGLRRSAIEETKRLLYVSMTRARDLLVLARPGKALGGEWVDCIEAPWLLAEEGHDALTLPSGERIAAVRWQLEPGEANETCAGPADGVIHWYERQADGEPRRPLAFSPSAAAAVPACVLEKVRVGERIPLVPGADMGVLGSAIHACIGVSFVDPTVPLAEDEVQAVLDRFSVRTYLTAGAVLRQVQALQAWINKRWPDAVPHAEIPAQSLLPTGQILNGRIDLLLETPQGWVVIDHKSTQLASSHWDQLAAEHGAQLEAYANAVERATGQRVLERWLFLPVAGGAVSLG